MNDIHAAMVVGILKGICHSHEADTPQLHKEGVYGVVHIKKQGAPAWRAVRLALQANGNLSAQGIAHFSPLAENETYRCGKRGFRLVCNCLVAEEVV